MLIVALLLCLELLKGEATSCEVLSDNCEFCLGNGKAMSCGWCRERGVCLEGTEAGPKNGSCQAWTFKFDMKCHLESTAEVSLGVRIGVTVFVSTVAVGTTVFWVCIFPQCASPAKPEREDEEARSE